ncbi:hypothetical protein M758_1G097300 [Ceratodon purpureus]|nr:hypothetical protein M758_1G097300 [Ceratodon purpureus]
MCDPWCALSGRKSRLKLFLSIGSPCDIIKQLRSIRCFSYPRRQLEITCLLPGSAFERYEKSQEVNTIRRETASPTASGPGTNARRLIVLVIFIGGVTSVEISSLRFLESQEDMKYDFMVATTKLINGTTLIKSLIHDHSTS